MLIMKIVTVVGARPQFIKASVVSRAIETSTDIQEIIIHTGQHFDINMSDIFFKDMCIPKPQKNLNINGLTHGAMTGQMMVRIEEILFDENPDWVLVYGDTNSTLAAALAAKKIHIKVAHVEAGLRSFNMYMPEEINRILTDRISDILFCPTDKAVENLKAEGYEKSSVKIIKSGDVMQDAANFYAEIARKPDFDLPEKFLLCTIHRAENTDNHFQLKEIFKALEKISERMKVILPLHPRTKAKLIDLGYDFSRSNICFLPPVGYLEMVYLLKGCSLVITDSGGLQKEAYFFSKCCITLREETEWVELVSGGFNVLTGSSYRKILDCFHKMIISKNNHFSGRLYGDGNAAGRILQELQAY